ncbi:hypothetical protein FH972_025825 [Carpinus fangiana]|uniref:Uncharacterized protein n=1 Tax=Carpinus fangiana TaxID=176857 RepID=A0A5N6L349_9ROSI|nr:hypothetical protein FH972_025825 [Carpinus fangiana]
MASDAKRPRLKVSIPTEQSESEGDSSTRDRGTDTTPNKPATTGSSHSSGLVLPAPSPRSAGGDNILSAGATGPPNPFARPAAPTQTLGSNTQSNAYRDGIDTPMSALPSRVMTEGGFNMGSPSAFFPEGGNWFGQYGSNSLASPATYQPTPINTNAPSFSDPRRKNDEDEDGTPQRKR